MLCDECHENEGIYTVSMLINGESTVRHLCSECMERMNGHFISGNIRGLLSTILGAIAGHGLEEEDVAAPEETHPTEDDTDDGGAICASCGTTLSQFRKTGYFGCAACYDAFRSPVRSRLLKQYGSTQHTGRKPLSDEDAQRSRTLLDEFSRQMAEAIEREDFEQAATLRDRIRALSAQEVQA